jgi:hypothetical protein
MAKVFTIPVPPKLGRATKREGSSDPRYVDGQKLLVEAMKYLAQSDPITNVVVGRGPRQIILLRPRRLGASPSKRNPSSKLNNARIVG